MLSDLKYAFRALVRQPVLSTVALATLVLGIGANTAIFSLVKGVLLDSLPYESSEELVMLRERKPDGGTDFVAPPTYLDWKARSTTVPDLAAYRHVRYGFKAEDEPLDLPSLSATPELFNVLKSSALIGRTFTEEEGTPGKDKVAVLSHGMWQRHFGSDRGVLGRQIELDAVRYAVVGVMSESFEFPPGSDVNLWTPLAFDPNDAHGRSRRARALSVVGRMKPGVSLEQAREEMSALAAALGEEYPDTNAGWGVETESAHEQMVQATRPALLMLMAAVGFLLLIVCANVANLMLARLATRRREIALRASLGAGRTALVRQVLAESFLLSIAGAILGIGTAWVGIRIARNLPVSNVPRLDQVQLDGGVLLFTALVSVVVALGFGLVPALRASSPQLRDSLSENTRGGSLKARRALSIIVAAEVALALVLLIGAGLTIRSFREMMSVDPGFRPTNVMATQIYLPRAKYTDGESRLRFFRESLERLRSTPGIAAAGAASALPMHPVGIDFALPFTVEGRNPPPSGEEPRADIRSVTEGYFETMNIPLLRGRVIEPRDREDSPHVLLINETLARRYFVDEDPLGKIIDNPHGKAEVIGVVSDVHHYGLDADPRPELYLAFSQNVFPGMSVVVRTSLPPERMIPDIRSAVWSVDPDQAIYDMSTMDQAIARWVFLPRLSTTLLAAFAAAALLLASLGIYGVIAYSVSQRTTEMGLRMALGAGGSALVGLIVRGSMKFVAIGMVLGLGASFVLTRFLSGQLYGVGRLDPLVFVGVSLLLGVVALVASVIPARRATTVDPLEALRVE
jgi:putative ABC transport system permease protein